MSEYNSQVYTGGKTLQQYITGVFTTMGLGLLLTAVVAFLGYYNLISGGWMYQLVMNGGYSILTLVLFVVQISLCIALSRGLQTMNPGRAKAMFLGYAAITGFTFSILPLAFGTATVFTAFAFSAVMYFAAAVIGHFTRVDLSKFTGIFIGGLFALILVSILSMFIPALADSLVVSYIGVLLFLGITAWDMQRIKAFYYNTQGNDTLSQNLAIYGAFELYLDFINIFLYVLRIFGRGSSRN
jgi:FtsH-binding integral membrane protein